MTQTTFAGAHQCWFKVSFQTHFTLLFLIFWVVSDIKKGAGRTSTHSPSLRNSGFGLALLTSPPLQPVPGLLIRVKGSLHQDGEH